MDRKMSTLYGRSSDYVVGGESRLVYCSANTQQLSTGVFYGRFLITKHS